MYGDLECIGWYSVRTGPTCTGSKEDDFPKTQDLQLQKNVFSKFCENPLMIVMNPLSDAAKDKKKLPLFIYDTELTQEENKKHKV